MTQRTTQNCPFWAGDHSIQVVKRLTLTAYHLEILESFKNDFVLLKQFEKLAVQKNEYQNVYVEKAGFFYFIKIKVLRKKQAENCEIWRRA